MHAAHWHIFFPFINNTHAAKDSVVKKEEEEERKKEEIIIIIIYTIRGGGLYILSTHTVRSRSDTYNDNGQFSFFFSGMEF